MNACIRWGYSPHVIVASAVGGGVNPRATWACMRPPGLPRLAEIRARADARGG
jgi:hypothetical protein